MGDFRLELKDLVILKGDSHEIHMNFVFTKGWLDKVAFISPSRYAVTALLDT